MWYFQDKCAHAIVTMTANASSNGHDIRCTKIKTFDCETLAQKGRKMSMRKDKS